jgi:carbon-monoxide dehydrogenase small subunit
MRLTLTINGAMRRGEIEPRTLLSDFIRHEVGLTGTHVGCEQGSCGACTVLMDGEPVRSCLMLAVQADGRELRTVEGLGGADGALSPLQQAFKEHHAAQCGFCTPGFLIVATALLERNPSPDEQEIRRELSGNLCRCTGYEAIVDAVLSLARASRAVVGEASSRSGSSTVLRLDCGSRSSGRLPPTV